MLDANGKELHPGDIVRLSDAERNEYMDLPNVEYVYMEDGNRETYCRIKALHDFKWHSVSFNDIYGAGGFVVEVRNVIKDTFMQHVLEALANDLPGQER